MGDEDQLYRAFINIIKNADESIIEILNKKPKYEGKIEIDILTNKDYIITIIKDNGKGISDTKKVEGEIYLHQVEKNHNKKIVK